MQQKGRQQQRLFGYNNTDRRKFIMQEVSKEKEAKAKSNSTASKTKKTAKAKPAVFIQSMECAEAKLEDILSRVKDAASQMSSEPVSAIYIKAEENRAYFVAGQVTGWAILWD